MKFKKLLVPLSILSISIPTCGITCFPVSAETKQTGTAKTSDNSTTAVTAESTDKKNTASNSGNDSGFTGEKTENGIIYYYENGVRYTGNRTIDKVTYHFTDGLKTDIYIKVEDKDVLVPIKGNKWVTVNGYMHFVKDANVIKGWKKMTKDDGESKDHMSFFDKKTGRLYTGWRKMGKAEGEKNEHWSYFGPNGWLRTGWQQMGKGTNNPDGNAAMHWSYFGPNGWLRTDWQQMATKDNPDGKSNIHWSYFGPNGWLRTDWQQMATKDNPDGKSKVHWSYFGGNGWLVTSKTKVNGMTLYFSSKGWLNRYETLTPHYSQYKYGFYTGCAGTNLLMALQYKGYLKDWGLKKFMSTMPYAKDNNPNNGFVGSPKTFIISDKNRGIYPKALAKWGSKYGNVEDISGKDMNAVADEVRKGNPVLILATYNFHDFPVKKCSWGLYRPDNHHFFLLVGYDYNTDKYKVMDPLLTSGNGSKWLNGSQLRYIYNQIKGAVIVR